MLSPRKNLNPPLNRRSWLALAVASLSGCGGGASGGAGGGSSSSGGGGGGGGGISAGAPGTGGTGQYAMLYSQGSITGFGSVIINGIKFDDGLASVQLDGAAAVSADLRLGMVAAVQGQRSASAALGTASRIEVWSVAQGLVTQLLTAGGTEFTVAGMTVQTDSATVFDGVSTAAQLSAGSRVAVWGLQASADGRRWKATRVALVTATTQVSTGLVSVSGLQRQLNGLTLTGSAAAALTAGQLARVQGALSADGASVAVERVTPLGVGLVGAQPDGDIEIEGFVTSTPANGRFMLGSIEVDTGSAVYSPAGASVVLGARVEVYGAWQAGVLKATKVELETEDSLHAVEIEARIEQFTSLADFVLRGQRCDASSARLSHGKAADLKVGLKVKVKGAKAGGDVLIVTEMEIGQD
ncbi:MAG: DUF5666 domain-containing protein [Polaromonas sp.]|nr:DUF5666 domain-containing protein [Polaromonas sp.]